MRLFVLGALLVATTASTASAQINFSSTVFDTPVQGSYLLDFEGSPPSGITLSGGSIQTGLFSGFAAPPAGVTNRYFASPGTGMALPGGAIIDFTGFLGSQVVTQLSFYWGSIDTYNTLDILGLNGSTMLSIGGSQVINPADGNQFGGATNRRLTLTFGGQSAFDFRGLRLNSTQRAFEIDNLDAVLVDRSTVVPEPATASVLALGLVMLGAAGARRKRNTV